jgi:hypothetical protein
MTMAPTGVILQVHTATGAWGTTAMGSRAE